MACVWFVEGRNHGLEEDPRSGASANARGGEAADKECDHIAATGAVRADLVGDILGFFRSFFDGLHDPKEDGLLFAHFHTQGLLLTFGRPRGTIGVGGFPSGG